jgi:hypothetical protein
MVRDLLHLHELLVLRAPYLVDGAVTAAQAYRPLSRAVSLKWLVVVARHFADLFQATQRHVGDPRSKLGRHVWGYPHEIALRPPAEEDPADHDGECTPGWCTRKACGSPSMA